MYLSCLLIDVGTDPDRPRPGRLWLRNLYRVHQRLCMAFPSKDRRVADVRFLKPYAPTDFPEHRHLADKQPSEVAAETLRQVHAKRNNLSGFLFRVDPQPGGRVAILVLSALQPDWDYAFQNARHLLAAPPSKARPLRLSLLAGTRLQFHLVANPTKRLRRDSQNQRGQPTDEAWIGKRVPVPGEELEKWLARRAEPCGFRLEAVNNLQPGYVYVNKTPNRAGGYRLRSVRYEGVLEVTDPDRFRETLIRGIGPAKAFGFGLLSVAPA